MNEALLKYVYDETEKVGYALIQGSYESDVRELEDNDLIETDPAGFAQDGSIRVSVTPDGQKWVEAMNVAKVEEKPVAASPQPKKRGRPAKAQQPAMQVLSEGPITIVEEELLPSPGGFALPTSQEPEKSATPVWAQPAHVELEGEHVEDIGAGVVSITPESPKGDLVGTQVISGFVPPARKRRMKAEELLAPYSFGIMNINDMFYVPVELMENNFKYIVATANRKLEPKRFAVYDADKIVGAPMKTGFYCFRLE